MYGRYPLISKEIIHPSSDELKSENRYAKELAEKMNEAFKIVQLNIDRKLKYSEKSYKHNIIYIVTLYTDVVYNITYYCLHAPEV